MNKQSDLTTGGILQKLVFVAVPIMGTQLMQMLYNITDMFWLGRLSSDAVAASGLAGMYLWLSVALFMFGRMGAEIGVSQSKGRGDMETAKAFAQNALSLSLLMGVLFAIPLIFFSDALVSVFNIQEANLAGDTSIYLLIVGFGMPAAYMSGAFTGAFTGAGNSRVPFYMNAIGILINIILDPILIFSLGLGIRGAALATPIAQWTVFFLLLWSMKRHKDRPFSQFKLKIIFDGEISKQIIRWATPIALESGFFTLLTMMLTRLIAGFGAEALAVSRVGTQIESLSWLIGGGFGTALTAFVGQNFGSEKWGRIGRGFRISSALMLVWGIVISFAMFFGGYALFGLFLPEHELREMGATLMKIAAFAQIAVCMEAVGGGMFRGIGRTVPPSVVSIICNAARVPLCYWLATTSLGLNGIWWGGVIGTVLRGFVIFGWSFVVLKRKSP